VCSEATVENECAAMMDFGCVPLWILLPVFLSSVVQGNGSGMLPFALHYYSEFLSYRKVGKTKF